MAGNQLTLAYLQAEFSSSEQAAWEQTLKTRTSSLRPNIDQLDARRRVRRTLQEIEDLETQPAESISAYKPKTRGEHSYCAARAPDQRRRPYHEITPNKPCNCDTEHQVRNPRQWQSSPAEESDWDYSLPNGGHSVRAPKVRFADPIVTDVKVFERWYADSYGKVVPTQDGSTEAMDEREIEIPNALAAVIGTRDVVEPQSMKPSGLVSWADSALMMMMTGSP